MKHVIQRAAVTVAILSCALFPAAVFANSSWVWISEKRPYDLLPFVIAGTLIIEIAVIYRIPKMKKNVQSLRAGDSSQPVVFCGAVSFADPQRCGLFFCGKSGRLPILYREHPIFDHDFGSRSALPLQISSKRHGKGKDAAPHSDRGQRTNHNWSSGCRADLLLWELVTKARYSV